MIVETGEGVFNANSYASVAEATAYLEALYTPQQLTSWSAANTARKEAGLVSATSYLNDRYYGRWVGSRKTATQSLDWPRIATTDGMLIPSLPQNIKDAAIELAFRYVRDGQLLADVEGSQAGIKRISQQFAVFGETIEYVGSAQTQKEYTLVEQKLSRYLIGSLGMRENERG